MVREKGQKKYLPPHRDLIASQLDRFKIYYNVLKATLWLYLFYRKPLDPIAPLCQQQIKPNEIFYSQGYFCFMFYLQLLFHFWSLLHLLIPFYLCSLNGSLWFQNAVQQFCTHSIKPDLRFRCYCLSFLSFYCFTWLKIQSHQNTHQARVLNIPQKKAT